jgi:hypothetical protein
MQEEEEKNVQIDLDDYIKSFASFFYAKPEDLNAQFNKLQPSQCKVLLTNNWAFPGRAFDDPKTLSQVRMRLAVAQTPRYYFLPKKCLNCCD